MTAVNASADSSDGRTHIKLNMKESNEKGYKSIEMLQVPTDSAGPTYQTLNRQKAQSNFYDVIRNEKQRKCSNAKQTVKQWIFSKTFLYALITANVALLIFGAVAVVLFILAGQTVIQKIDKAMETTQSTSGRQSHDTVAFTAIGCTGNNPIIFPDIIQNKGGVYNSSSGKFTCHTPGIYFFASVMYAYSTYNSTCFLYINSNGVVGTGKNGYPLILSGTFYLNVSDTVHVACVKEKMDKNAGSFTGFLVTADENSA